MLSQQCSVTSLRSPREPANQVRLSPSNILDSASLSVSFTLAGLEGVSIKNSEGEEEEEDTWLR